MADFNPVTPTELASLRALRVARRLLRRLDLRVTIHRARVRVARGLKGARNMRTAADLRFHASITEREARSLQALANGVSGRRAYEKVLQRALASLRVKS